MASHINSICLPTKRPFSWRALWILVALQLQGILLSIPPLRATNQPLDPFPYMIILTAISIPIIVPALYLASRIGLGTPLLEGYLQKRIKRIWAMTVIAIDAVASAIIFPAYISGNLLIQFITSIGIIFAAVILWLVFKKTKIEKITY